MTQESPKAQKLKFTCGAADDGKLLVDVIADKSGLSKSLVKKIMIFGGIYQTIKGKKKRSRKAKTCLKTGDKVECFFDPNIDIDKVYEFKCLYETRQFGIYHKPAGALTEGNDYGDKSSLFRYVEKLKKYAYPVNRLDMETEGLVIIAFNSKAQNHLQEMWRKDVVKNYQAIVLGNFEGSGSIDREINNKFSETKYECIKSVDGETYVEITPTTERKHQIRIHFKNLGHPIIGDPRYGRDNKNKEGLQLICYQLTFVNPSDKKKIKVTLPKDRLLF